MDRLLRRWWRQNPRTPQAIVRMTANGMDKPRAIALICRWATELLGRLDSVDGVMGLDDIGLEVTLDEVGVATISVRGLWNAISTWMVAGAPCDVIGEDVADGIMPEDVILSVAEGEGILDTAWLEVVLGVNGKAGLHILSVDSSSKNYQPMFE